MKHLLILAIAICTISCASNKKSSNRQYLSKKQIDSLSTNFESFDSFLSKTSSLPDGTLTFGNSIPDAYASDQDSFQYNRPAIFRNTKLVLKTIPNGHNNINLLYCIDSGGNVNYIEYLEEESSTNLNETEILKLMHGFSTYKFKKDKSAHEQECGIYKFTFDLHGISKNSTPSPISKKLRPDRGAIRNR